MAKPVNRYPLQKLNLLMYHVAYFTDNFRNNKELLLLEMKLIEKEPVFVFCHKERKKSCCKKLHTLTDILCSFAIKI